jgi:hypothetical protein
VFIFHEGYWGPYVGFYGGIVYGFGYEGVGYEGGYWNRGVFFYNRSVNNIRNVTNVYNKTLPRHRFLCTSNPSAPAIRKKFEKNLERIGERELQSDHKLRVVNPPPRAE